MSKKQIIIIGVKLCVICLFAAASLALVNNITYPFYDINGNDHALKYHTTGTTVSNGDVLRAVETKSIGYTNNGTAESFKKYTDYVD